jgi:TetR/AcrR family hemagglutinin/protease transcriptional regulator
MRQVAGTRPRAARLAPAARRAGLLACAVRVFARRGLAAARHAEIANEAAVSLSTVFVYFPTRPALVDAVLDEVERFLLAQAEAVHALDGPTAAVLQTHAAAFAASVDTHPDLVRIWIEWSTAMRAEVWPRYLDFQERMVRIIAATIARGRASGELAGDDDPEDDARLLVAAAHMIAQMKLTHRDPALVDRFLRTIVRATAGEGGRLAATAGAGARPAATAGDAARPAATAAAGARRPRPRRTTRAR